MFWKTEKCNLKFSFFASDETLQTNMKKVKGREQKGGSADYI